MKSRQRVIFKPYRGAVVAQKWPKKRGSSMTPRQKAWVDRFSLWACLVKSPDATSYDGAKKWTEGSGWFWRDALMAAMAGNLIEVPGEIKITTPTAHLSRSDVLALAAGVNVAVPMQATEWDNNNFWASAPNPTRITCQSPGLYLISASGNFENTATDKSVAITMRINGGASFQQVRSQDIINQDVLLQNTQLWYFHAGDYAEVLVISTIAAQLNSANFWIVAITPEAVLP